ncbi:transposase [Aquisalimonas sp.]|uniref:transposase n=1 Tax=Aquisalimonas sp. TaxID=1872621 RepID=UPI0025BEBC94|nr:transposase [Aquisalimonas sp.]
MAAVEMDDERPVYVRFDPVEGFSFKALRQWAERALAPGSQVTTDGMLGFEVFGQLGPTHRVVLAPRGKAGTEIPAFRWLNTVLGNVKTALSGKKWTRISEAGDRYLRVVPGCGPRDGS